VFFILERKVFVLTKYSGYHVDGLAELGEDCTMIDIPKGTIVIPYRNGMHKTIQESAKEKVIALLADYDVAYIDYDAKENEYSIRLDKEKLENEAVVGEGVYLDGGKVAEAVYTDIDAGEEVIPLLNIALDDINSVPTVHYKGEEVTFKQRVLFDFKTKDECPNPTYIHIEHWDKEGKLTNSKVIQHNHPNDRDNDRV
jgi:hypothetical protein